MRILICCLFCILGCTPQLPQFQRAQPYVPMVTAARPQLQHLIPPGTELSANPGSMVDTIFTVVGDRVDFLRSSQTQFVYKIDDKTTVTIPQKLPFTAVRNGTVITITFTGEKPYAKYGFIGAHITDLLIDRTQEQLKVGLFGFHPIKIKISQ